MQSRHAVMLVAVVWLAACQTTSKQAEVNDAGAIGADGKTAVQPADQSVPVSADAGEQDAKFSPEAGDATPANVDPSNPAEAVNDEPAQESEVADEAAAPTSSAPVTTSPVAGETAAVEEEDWPVEVPQGRCLGGQVNGQLVAAESPVVVAATLTGDVPTDSGQIFISPTSADGTALVALASSERLIEVAPSGVSVEDTAVCGQTVGLLTADDDTSQLLALTEDDTPARRYYSLWTSGEQSWQPDFIVGGVVNRGVYGDEYSGDLIIDAAFSSDGDLRVLTRRSSNLVSLWQRQSQDTWQAQPVTSSATEADLGTDSLGRLRVGYNSARVGSSNFDSGEWLEGGTARELATPSSDRNIAVAGGSGGLLAIARWTTDGISVIFSDGTADMGDQVVPDTSLFIRGADPCYTRLSSCEPVTCERTGILPEQMALASTDDGRFWLVYADLHISDHYDVSGTNTHYCFVFADRTTVNEIALVELFSDGSVGPTQRWKYTSSSSAWDLDVTSRGQNLYLGVAEQGAAQVFVLDTTQL